MTGFVTVILPGQDTFSADGKTPPRRSSSVDQGLPIAAVGDRHAGLRLSLRTNPNGSELARSDVDVAAVAAAYAVTNNASDAARLVDWTRFAGHEACGEILAGLAVRASVDRTSAGLRYANCVP